MTWLWKKLEIDIQNILNNECYLVSAFVKLFLNHTFEAKYCSPNLTGFKNLSGLADLKSANFAVK